MKSISNYINESLQMNLFEAFSNKDVEKAITLIRSLVRKYQHGSLKHMIPVEIDGVEMSTLLCMANSMERMVGINFNKNDKSTGVYSITLWTGFDECNRASQAFINGDTSQTFKSTSYSMLQYNIVHTLNAVIDILNGSAPDMALAKLPKQFESAELDEPATVCEGWIDNYNNLDKILAQKASTKGKIGYLKLLLSRPTKQTTQDMLDDIQGRINKLEQEPAETKSAPTAKLTSAKAVRQANVERVNNWWEQQFQEYKVGNQTGKQKIADMEHLIKLMCVKESYRLPLCIFAGAPGIGKTYNITTILKSVFGPAGVRGSKGMWDMRQGGKTTGTALYQALFNCRHEGDILVLDDCDKSLTDEDALNLLKGATDSSQERQVSWSIGGGAATPIAMDMREYEEYYQELLKIYHDDASIPFSKMPGERTKGENTEYFLPKSFFFNGKIIIATNKGLGDIEKALRSRGHNVDLTMSTVEYVDILEEIAPKLKDVDKQYIEPALAFLKELAEKVMAEEERGNKIPFEVSIRTFRKICLDYEFFCDLPEAQLKAKIMRSLRDEFSEALACK